MKRHWMMAARAMVIGAAVGAAALAGGCESAVSEDTYEQISTGMTLDQVQKLMGEGTQEVSGGATISSGGMLGGTNDAQSSRKTYTWKEGNKMIVVDFQDGKVVSKSKRGF